MTNQGSDGTGQLHVFMKGARSVRSSKDDLLNWTGIQSWQRRGSAAPPDGLIDGGWKLGSRRPLDLSRPEGKAPGCSPCLPSGGGLLLVLGSQKEGVSEVELGLGGCYVLGGDGLS